MRRVAKTLNVERRDGGSSVVGDFRVRLSYSDWRKPGDGLSHGSIGQEARTVSGRRKRWSCTTHRYKDQPPPILRNTETFGVHGPIDIVVAIIVEKPKKSLECAIPLNPSKARHVFHQHLARKSGCDQSSKCTKQRGIMAAFAVLKLLAKWLTRGATCKEHLPGRNSLAILLEIRKRQIPNVGFDERCRQIVLFVALTAGVIAIKTGNDVYSCV
jgi:hypothetical protein